jgi:predicted NBD/HSP70 family sugar kinase
MARGANLPSVAGFNQTVVLDHIRRAADGLSRVELAGETGLSAQTVTNVVRRLTDLGFVRETGKAIDGPGQPRRILQLDPSGGFAVGVHMDPAVITYVLVNLSGTIVAESRMRMPETRDVSATTEKIISSVRHLIESAGVAVDRVLGIGIAAPGPIDATEGIIVRPPLALAWSGFPIKQRLVEAFALPVLIAKDASAAGFAERWNSTSDPSAFTMFVYFGTGVGVGLILSDAVHVGLSANAGDVGHFKIVPDGMLCTCGRRGCFGITVQPRALVESAISSGALAAPDRALDFEIIDQLFHTLVSKAERGDPACSAILNGSIDATALFVNSVADLLDLKRVVFGGPGWPVIEQSYLKALPSKLRELRNLDDPLLHEIQIRSSVVGTDVAAVGAACLVLDSSLSPRSAQLVIA